MSDQHASEAEIRSVQRRWIEASEREDFETVASLMTDDVVFITANRPPFGKKEYLEASLASKGKFQLQGKADMHEILVSGDLAVTQTSLRIELHLPDGTVKVMSGPVLSVFRKEQDGQWRLSRDANFVSPVGSA